MAGALGSTTERLNLLNLAGHAPKLAASATGQTASGSTLSWNPTTKSFDLVSGGGGGGGTPSSTVAGATLFGLSPAVGIATAYARGDHSHGTPPLGTTAATACAGNDARLSDARAPNGSASGDLGGSYPSPTVTRARGLRDSGGTTYAMGALAEGQVLRVTGGAIVGAWLALALSVTPTIEGIELLGDAVVYPSILSDSGTVL